MKNKKQKLMRKIIVDNVFLKLKSPVCSGFITGLKKLSQNGYEIEFDGKISKSSPALKIINFEKIKLSTGNKSLPAFIITTTGAGSANTVRVSAKGKIKNFGDAADEIIRRTRSAVHRRTTKETDIRVYAALDGRGKGKIKTGIGFFDHMLEQIAKHANIDLSVSVKGDLQIDEHHTVEDVGLTFGVALNEALGEKTGIKRYGYFLPMDDSIANCAIDLGGRSYLNFNCKFTREMVGGFPTELTEEFFKSMAAGLKANIYINTKGKNDHHKIEAIFKAFAKALNEACRLDERSAGSLPSTKGVL